MRCRHCNSPHLTQVIDLGTTAPSNSYVDKEALSVPTNRYPLKVNVCQHCWLVQTQDFADREEFFNHKYAYLSSMSQAWLHHAEQFCSAMKKRFGLDAGSFVIELASNDGYLLKNFQQWGIPNLGIEPTASCAAIAREAGIETVEEFFGTRLAATLVEEGRQADLVVANNVLAHVPDINDFVSGIVQVLKSDGVATIEFPHLKNMIECNQFDTIYHEHYSYLGLSSVNRIFQANGLTVFDVEELPTHGGSLRVYAHRSDPGHYQPAPAVKKLLERENAAGMNALPFYQGFQDAADRVRDDLLAFFEKAKAEKRKVAAYGAAAKGNTLLNFAGIRATEVVFVVDRSPLKTGCYMPDSLIPIVDETVLKEEKPNYVLILPWNLTAEIAEQLQYVREWGAQFVTAIPQLKIF